jgi:hypothetical protein
LSIFTGSGFFPAAPGPLAPVAAGGAPLPALVSVEADEAPLPPPPQPLAPARMTHAAIAGANLLQSRIFIAVPKKWHAAGIRRAPCESLDLPVAYG